MGIRSRLAVVRGIVLTGLVAGTALGAPLQEITEPDGTFHQQFGFSVAAEGDTMVTGDPDYIREDQPCVKERGAIAIFKKVNDVWQYSQRFRYIGDGTARNRLGWSVAIKGNVIIAATPGQDYVNGATTTTNAGAISVYRRPSATADFAFAGHAFAPNPTVNGEFTSLWPVATNGTLMAGTGFPGKPNDVHVYSLANNAINYVTTITTPLPIITSLYIMDQNVVVASFIGADAPVAYAVNGTQVTSVDNTVLRAPAMTVASSIVGDGNTLAFSRGSAGSSQQTLVVATFGVNAIQTVQASQLTPSLNGAERGSFGLKERSGFIVYDHPEATADFTSYVYAGGTYIRVGPVLGATTSSSFWSMAFSGTDFFFGVGIEHNDPTQICGRLGSIFVYRPLTDMLAALRLAPLMGTLF